MTTGVRHHAPASASAAARPCTAARIALRVLRRQQLRRPARPAPPARRPGRVSFGAAPCACRRAWRPWRAGACVAPSTVAKAASGIWQLPPNTFDTLRSAAHRLRGGRVVQRRQHGAQVDAVAAAGQDLDRHRALPGGRQAVLGFEQRADALRQAEALQAGGGQDDGRVLAAIELAQAGIEVAAQRLDDQLRIARRDQRLAAQAAGADHGAGRQRRPGWRNRSRRRRRADLRAPARRPARSLPAAPSARP